MAKESAEEKEARLFEHYVILYEQERYEAAIAPATELCELEQKIGGSNSAGYAISIANLASLYQHINNFQAAEPLYRQALDIWRATVGEHHPDYVISLNNLAVLYFDMGDYHAAKPLYRQALDIVRETLGERHPNYAIGLNNLAALYKDIKDYQAAEQLYRQALDIKRETIGEHHPDFAEILYNFAELYRDTYDYQAAEPLYRQALDIWRATVGERHPNYAIGLNNLAALYFDIGDYQAAEPLFRKVCNIQRVALGERHPKYAESLNNLANVYHTVCDFQAAELLYNQALDIARQTLGEQHPGYAISLNNLAGLYKDAGSYEAAEPLYRQALDIWRATVGERHPNYAIGLNNLAGLYLTTDNFQAAVPLYNQALDITRETLGERHPNYAKTLNNLAGLYKDLGDYQTAESLFHQAHEILRYTLGEHHPDYITSHNNLAGLLAATGRTAEAFDLMTRASLIEDHVIAQVFSIGSESQRMAYLQSIQTSLHVFLTISQHCTASNIAANAAMDLVLRRKAIGAEALAAQRDAVLGGKYPHLRESMNQFRMLTNEIAQDMLAGPRKESISSYRQHLYTLLAQREYLEAELAHQIPEMDLEHHLKTADRHAIAQHLPEDTALVEFVRFNEYNFAAVPAHGKNAWRAPRYLAFILRARTPDALTMIDLGEARDIDSLVIGFRASVIHRAHLSSNTSVEDGDVISGLAASGIDLRAAVFDPLVPYLGNITCLFIAPDGELNRLPFEALPTNDGKRLIDTYHISYLSVGRDVLRFAYEMTHAPTASVVIADPDYDLGSMTSSVASGLETHLQRLDFGRQQPEASKSLISHSKASVDESASMMTISTGRQSRDLPRELHPVSRLPRTANEGAEIADMLRVTNFDVDAWFQEYALERRLKGATSPRIIHLATHGFFLENQPRDITAAYTSFADIMRDRIAIAGFENPLLRSGLLLAGVNTWLKGREPPREAEDGVLTALDVSSLDLLATDLAVLSACDTGLGDVQTGEGVLGLRRAFMLAGAKTLVMSLWSVDDKATEELMVDFYNRILKGEGCAEALRNAQLAIKDKHPDPYYWGAFICQGDPRPLNRMQQRLND